MTADREAMTLERQAFEKWAASKPDDWFDEASAEAIAWIAWQTGADLSRAAEPVGTLVVEPDKTNQYGKNARVVLHDECMQRPIGAHPIYTNPSEGARDARRLDWMDAHPRLSTIVVNGVPTECYFYGVAGAMGLKLREVIDAAMAKENCNGSD